jgi:hypothetical protein
MNCWVLRVQSLTSGTELTPMPECRCRIDLVGFRYISGILLCCKVSRFEEPSWDAEPKIELRPRPVLHETSGQPTHCWAKLHPLSYPTELSCNPTEVAPYWAIRCSFWVTLQHTELRCPLLSIAAAYRATLCPTGYSLPNWPTVYPTELYVSSCRDALQPTELRWALLLHLWATHPNWAT